MNRSKRLESGKLKHELADFQLMAKRLHHQLEKNWLLQQQLEFWISSAEFLITELDVWDQQNNMKKHEETVETLKQILDHLLDLILQAAEETGENREWDGNDDFP